MVANTGVATTNGVWSDSIYLQPAGGGADILLGQLSSPINLAPDTDYSRTDTFALPNGISGQYAIEVVTNSNDAIPELNNANDSLVSSAFPIYLTPYADLQVSSVIAPPSAVAGQTATFQWTVVNAGTGATDAPQWIDDLYLSTSATSLTGAILVGSAMNPAYLCPGIRTTNR